MSKNNLMRNFHKIMLMSKLLLAIWDLLQTHADQNNQHSETIIVIKLWIRDTRLQRNDGIPGRLEEKDIFL